MSSSDHPAVETLLTSTSSLTMPPPSNPPPATSAQGAMSPPEPQPSSWDGAGQQRAPFEIPLPSDNFPSQSNHPCEKAKVLLTTVSAKRRQEVAEIHSRRMLQLARASREAFEAQAKYRLLRIQELDIMHTIAHDEYEEAQCLVRDAYRQIGEIRHTLTTLGIPLYDNSLRDKAPTVKLSPVPSVSDLPDADDLSGSCSGSPLLDEPRGNFLIPTTVGP